MAQMDKTYINEIQKQFGYHPAWAPNRPYELGDYGDPQNDQFEMLGNIRKWVTPKPSSHASGPMYYTSTGDVKVNVDFRVADVTKQAQVDLKINFAKKWGIFFLAQNPTVITTQNLEQVGDKIVSTYKKSGKDWRLSYTWIAELIKAEYLTVLIALDSSTDITLSGKLPITAQGVPVAQLDLRNFSVTKNASRVMTYQGANLTPLFRLYEVKDPITKKAYYTEYK